MQCLVRHRPQEFPPLWGSAELVGEPPCLPGAHWQSRCSLTQSPIPRWLGLNSGSTDQGTWQLPGEVAGALPLLRGPPRAQGWRPEGPRQRACPQPLWQRSPAPVSASETGAVCPAAAPFRVASCAAAHRLPLPCRGGCLRRRLLGPWGTEALGAASLSKAPYWAKGLLEVSWEPETWLEGSSLGTWVGGAALPLGPCVKAPP